jgi:Protein of unknown function (DUF3102)
MSKKVKARAVKRALETIACEIHAALKREAANIITIGGLLVEAKAQLMHGQWLPWLEREFSLSQRSAQRYVKAYKFAVKYDTVSDLNLSPGALYAISSGHRKFCTPKAIAAILEEAKEKRVGEDRLWEIIWDPAHSLQPKTEAEIEAEAETAAEAAGREAEERAEAEAILDAPTPDLPEPSPEPPTLPRDQFLLSSFAQGVKLLREVMTSPASKFATGDVSAAHLESVADFLRQIAASIKARAA